MRQVYQAFCPECWHVAFQFVSANSRFMKELKWGTQDLWHKASVEVLRVRVLEAFSDFVLCIISWHAGYTLGEQHQGTHHINRTVCTQNETEGLKAYGGDFCACLVKVFFAN